MFYAHVVLAKKGPLARIWLAAHWDKKLTKAHVFETNIEQSVDGIMQPKVKLALRTSGHLLLGVVRIYSRKAKYLLADCNEAFVKIKMAFRPGMVDLPEEHREAAVNAITLPEVFHDFDTALPELNDVDIEAQFSINQSRADEITMREDYGNLPMSIHDDGFGDIGFDADGPDFIRDEVDPSIDDNLIDDSTDLDRREPMAGTSRMMNLEAQNLISDDGFGESGFGQEQAVGLFEGELFSDAPLQQSNAPQMEHDSEDDDMGGAWDTGAASPTASSSGDSRPMTPTAEAADLLGARVEGAAGSPIQMHDDTPLAHIDAGQDQSIDAIQGGDAAESAIDQDEEHEAEESFALAPIDASALRGITKTKRKRKLIVDEVKNISGEEMKSQLANTSDIITTLDLAPPTKRLMFWKETGGWEKLFTTPSTNNRTKDLLKNIQRNYITLQRGVEDFPQLGPADVLGLDLHEQPQQPMTPQEPIVAGKRGRKRKLQQQDITPLEHALARQGPQEDESSHIGQPLEASYASMRSDQPEMRPDVADLSRPEQPEMSQELPLPFVPETPFPSSGMTPVGLDGDYGMLMTPQHPSIDQIESIPNLPVDQVSSILNGAEMDTFSNLGYDDNHMAGASERIANDWNDDYDFPPSVGPAQPGDEQMENETDEQFEERVLNKRAAQMFVSVRARLQKQDSIHLSEMTYRNNRKQAAQKFYSLLVLKKFQALEIRQDQPYGDIEVTRGIMFDNPKL